MGNARLIEGIWCIKHGRIGTEKPWKGKEAIYYLSYGNTTSPLKILKLKPTDKEQLLDMYITFNFNTYNILSFQVYYRC